ncbi:hypothetical protein TrVE_jg1983 [Triparma verrucosa]|uniref:Uncharacterized protein n=1 Tax=Triparma verrucosa TaxID=1606542 RepID=A0A9W7BFC8_9STRA|nr:hypothetical protein TrVE_jg1983 [Triparma verrucosa]
MPNKHQLLIDALQAELEAERKANSEAVARFQAELTVNAETLASLKAEKEEEVGALTSQLNTAKEEAAAEIDAERKAKEANAEKVARLNAEKEEAAAQLDAERKAKDEAIRKLQTVVAEINSDAALQARRRRADATATSVEPLDPDTPLVRKVGANVLSQNTTINDCHSDVTIHEEPEVFLEALLGDQPKLGKSLFQKTLGDSVVYWSFMVTATICCDLLLHMSRAQSSS